MAASLPLGNGESPDPPGGLLCLAGGKWVGGAPGSGQMGQESRLPIGSLLTPKGACVGVSLQPSGDECLCLASMNVTPVGELGRVDLGQGFFLLACWCFLLAGIFSYNFEAKRKPSKLTTLSFL